MLDNDFALYLAFYRIITWMILLVLKSDDPIDRRSETLNQMIPENVKKTV